MILGAAEAIEITPIETFDVGLPKNTRNGFQEVEINVDGKEKWHRESFPMCLLLENAYTCLSRKRLYLSEPQSNHDLF